MCVYVAVKFRKYGWEILQKPLSLTHCITSNTSVNIIIDSIIRKIYIIFAPISRSVFLLNMCILCESISFRVWDTSKDSVNRMCVESKSVRQSKCCSLIVNCISEVKKPMYRFKGCDVLTTHSISMNYLIGTTKLVTIIVNWIRYASVHRSSDICIGLCSHTAQRTKNYPNNGNIMITSHHFHWFC